MPPFGIFRSEFEIVGGGLAASPTRATVMLVVLVTVAFLGLTLATNRMLLLRGLPDRRGSADPR